MKKNYFSVLLKSFYSKDFYIKVAKEWHGYAILYLCALIFFVQSIYVLKIAIQTNYYFHKNVFPQLKKIPPFKVVNSQLTIQNSESFMLFDPISGRVYLLIAPKLDHYSLSQNPVVQLSKNFLFFNYPDPFYNDINTKNYVTTRNTQLAYPKFSNNFDNKELIELTNMILIMIPFAAFLSGFIASFIVTIIEIIYLTITGLLLNVFTHRNLDFVQILRLAVVALTPYIIIDLVIRLLSLSRDIYFFMLLNLISNLTYLTLGILAQEKKSHTN